jgi:anti-sigma regulatory factor (Ser/Thr protein kinase)
MDLELECDPRNVAVARHAAADLARRVGAPADDVKIAVSEAVGNAVLHAYRDGLIGKIRVRGWQARDRLLIMVEDQGVGMTPHPDNPGLRMGIPIITKLCDDVRFASSDRGTVISMSFPAAM